MKSSKSKVLISFLLVFFVIAAMGVAFFFYKSSLNEQKNTKNKLSGAFLSLSNTGDIVSFDFQNEKEIDRKQISPYSEESTAKNVDNGILVIDNKNKKNTLIAIDETEKITMSEIEYPKNSKKIEDIEMNDDYTVINDSSLSELIITDNKKGEIFEVEIKGKTLIELSGSILYYTENEKIFAMDLISRKIVEFQNLKHEISNIKVFSSGIYATSKYGESVKNIIIFEFDQNLKAVNMHESTMSSISFIGNSEDASYIEGMSSSNYSIKKFQGFSGSTQIINKDEKDISVFSRGKIYNISDTLSIVDTESLVSDELEMTVKMVY